MKLQNFKPYNQLDYFDCYLRALFHILNYFHLDVRSVLLGHVYAYTYTNPNRTSFCLFQYNFKESVLENSGLCAEGILIDKSNFGRQILECCKANRPALLVIDNYYFPFSRDMYHESHNVHCICLYGYEKEKKQYHAIDVDFLNSFAYKEQIIEASSMQKFFEASGDNELYFCAFSKAVSDEMDERDYMKEYFKVLLRHKDLLVQGIEKLMGFIQFTLGSISDKNPKNVSEFIQKFTMPFVNIARSVKQREEILKGYIKEKTLLDMLEKISEQWLVIRSVILKYARYDKAGRIGLLANLPVYCSAVAALERDFNERLLETCQKQLGGCDE